MKGLPAKERRKIYHCVKAYIEAYYENG